MCIKKKPLLTFFWILPWFLLSGPYTFVAKIEFMRTFFIITFLSFSASCSAVEIERKQFTYRDSIVNYASEFIGTPYKSGGVSPSGFDCSGFVSYVFKKFGIQLPRSSKGMSVVGKAIESDEAQTGDIILFKGRASSTVGHVGIVYQMPTDDLVFIHSSSPRSGGVIVSSLSESYYQKRFVKIVDVLS
jgi:murein DD-endopeptidase / murein LD-carboxypeptidase